MEFIILDFGTPEKVAANLEMMADQTLSNQEPFLRIVEDMFRVEEVVFSSNGRRGGGSWAQLKPDTIKRKGNAQILRGTVDELLFRSVTQPGAPYQILQISNNEIIFGTERPYAEVHQRGAPSINVPARPFLKFTIKDIERWQGIILSHLTKPFRRVENE